MLFVLFVFNLVDEFYFFVGGDIATDKRCLHVCYVQYGWKTLFVENLPNVMK
jgi:hypothetical protein